MAYSKVPTAVERFDQLQDELLELDRRKQRLLTLMHRLKLQLPCPAGEHEYVSKECIAGAIPKSVEQHGIYGGYQVLNCVACGQWALANYGGEVKVEPIREDYAKRLMWC